MKEFFLQRTIGPATGTAARKFAVAGLAAKALLMIAATAGNAHAQSALTPIEETPLQRDAFATGILDSTNGALGGDIWRGANPSDLEFLLATLPRQFHVPSVGEAFRRLMLTASDTPAGAPASLAGRKLLALAEAGFTDEVRTIASLSNAPPNDPWVGQALAVADILEGSLDEACQRNAALVRGRDAPFWVKLRVLCYARAREFDAAELNLRILREQGGLSRDEDAYLTAASIPAPLEEQLALRDALQLAALRQIDPDLTELSLADADAGVLKALANDAAAPWPVRLDAGMRALAMGVFAVDELRDLYAAMPGVGADISAAREAILSAPGDPTTPVRVFRAVDLMAAPEFLRDRGALIASAVRSAPGFTQAYASARLYADDTTDLQGVLVTAQEAGAFALVRMSVGDADGAAQWLISMLGGGLSGLDEATADEFMDLLALLSSLDPDKAKMIASAANVDLAPLMIERDSRLRAGAYPDQGKDPAEFAKIVQATIRAVRENGSGQAALAALALYGDGYADDLVATVVRRAGFETAGLQSVAQRISFETHWRDQFGDASYDAAVAPNADDSPGDDRETRGFSPRLKPKP